MASTGQTPPAPLGIVMKAIPFPTPFSLPRAFYTGTAQAPLGSACLSPNGKGKSSVLFYSILGNEKLSGLFFFLFT